MEGTEAKVLLANLLERVQVGDDGHRRLPGTITKQEVAALELALSQFTIDSLPPPKVIARSESGAELRADQQQEEDLREPPIQLDLAALNAPPAPAGVRVCIDFGTAMSKATLVGDSIEGDETGPTDERIEVLELGRPGEQENFSETMLISSVYIDDLGCLWFGKKAVDLSLIEGQSGGGRRRLDDIKRVLTEGNIEDAVPDDFNPTSAPVSYGDMVGAYLMFLTWAVNEAVKEVVIELDAPHYLTRRFAMPCLQSDEATDIKSLLRQYLGEAQILADTFRQEMSSGISLTRFLSALKHLRGRNLNYAFLGESIVEPLGAANSMVSWQSDRESLSELSWLSSWNWRR